jgi:site-specific recombinase XerD
MKKKESLVIVQNSNLTKQLDNYNENLANKFKKARQSSTNISDFLTEFLGQFISPQTKKAYVKDLEFFFSFLASGAEYIEHPNQIDAHHFQFYRDDMIERGLASATINRRLVSIRSFMKWALASKIIDHNPLNVVKLPKVETETPTLAFDDHEVVSMIACPDILTKKGNSHRLVLVLLFSLGLRRSELVHIRCEDFYTERGHYVLKIRGKGGKERHLPIADYVANEVKDYLDRLKGFSIELSDKDFLIQSVAKYKNEVPMDGSTVFRIVNRYKDILGINKRVSPHSCRATAISHLLDTQKTSIRDVAIFAGHSKITTTERYDKRRKGLDDSAAYHVDYNQELTKKSS